MKEHARGFVISYEGEFIPFFHEERHALSLQKVLEDKKIAFLEESFFEKIDLYYTNYLAYVLNKSRYIVFTICSVEVEYDGILYIPEDFNDISPKQARLILSLEDMLKKFDANHLEIVSYKNMKNVMRQEYQTYSLLPFLDQLRTFDYLKNNKLKRKERRK